MPNESFAGPILPKVMASPSEMGLKKRILAPIGSYKSSIWPGWKREAHSVSMTHSVSMAHSVSRTHWWPPSLTIMETAWYTTCHGSWRSPRSPLPSPDPGVLAHSGREGVPPTAYLLMTVGHTFKGPVNLTSNKLEKPPTESGKGE